MVTEVLTRSALRRPRGTGMGMPTSSNISRAGRSSLISSSVSSGASSSKSGGGGLSFLEAIFLQLRIPGTPQTDQPNLVAAHDIDDGVALAIDPAEGQPSHLAVVKAIVDIEGGIGPVELIDQLERDLVLFQIGRVLALVPFIWVHSTPFNVRTKNITSIPSHRPLQVHDVEPAVEFIAQRLVAADQAEAVLFVQADRVGALGGDHREHLPEAEGFRLLQQPAEQGAAQAFSLRLGGEVDRILGGEAVGGAWPVGRGVGVADGLALGFGDDHRMAELQHVPE